MRRALYMAAWLLAAPVAARAQAPFEDGPFTVRSPNNDPDLVVVRERFQPDTRRQSLYLRLHDGNADFDRVSGVLSVRGATVAAVIYDGAELRATDAVWGIPAVDYGAGGAERGLEGEVLDHLPAPRDLDDHLSVFRGSVRFWFGSAADVDEVRIIVEYPVDFQGAEFEIQLFHRYLPDPLGFPPSTVAGLHVGSLADLTVDDGDYSETSFLPPVKLRVEDFDLVESSLNLGGVPELEGGLAGPRDFHVDNDFEDEDVDYDNGFDQNGITSPIPTAGPVERLRFTVDDLAGERGGRIAAAQVVIEDVPEVVERGERLTSRVSVQVPPGTAPDVYRGRVTVYEDNDGNGLRSAREPFDDLHIGVVVGVPPDADPDIGFPDSGTDGGPDAFVDAALPDTGRPDGGPPDASPDGTLDGGALDAGPDGAEDGGPGDARVDGGDGARPTDGAAEAGPADTGTDARPSVDGGRDGSLGDATPGDGALDASLDAVSDGGRPDSGPDGSVDAGDATPADGATDLGDGGVKDGTPTDPPIDDGARPPTADADRPGADAASDRLGQARGGAFECRSAPGHGGAPDPPWLLLLPLLRRRRPR